MKTATITERTKPEDFPQLEIERTRLVAMQTRLAEITTEQNQLLARRDDDRKTEQALVDRALDRANRADVSRQPDPALDSRFEELEKIAAELRAGIAIQRKRIEQLGYDVGKEICQSLMPQHREFARRVVFAVIELVKANEAEFNFRDELRTASVDGIESWLQPAEFWRGKIGTVQDLFFPNQPVGYFIDDKLERGFVTKAEIEKALAR